MSATSTTADHDHHGDHGGHDHHEHIHPPSYYVKTWAVLVVLLAVSIIGPELGIRAVTLFTAFGVAIIKAYLVCTNFMHLNVQKKFVVYFLVIALGFMALFFFAIAPDILFHKGGNWVNVAAIEEIERHGYNDDGTQKDGHHGAGHGGHHGDHHQGESAALKAHREEAHKKLVGIDAAMKTIASELKAQPSP